MRPPAQFARLSGVVATIALLTGLAAMAWVWGGDGSDPSSPRATELQGDPRKPAVPARAKPLVRPEGTVVLDTADTLGAISDAKVLPEAEIGVLTSHVGTVTAIVTTREALTTGTWLFALLPGQPPSNLAADINELYTTVGGFQTRAEAPPGVTVLTSRPPPGEAGAVTLRAHYVSRRGVVRVEAYGPDAKQVDEAFSALLEAQLKNTPQISR